MYFDELNTHPDIWTEKFHIGTCQVNLKREVSTEALFGFLQEVAVNQGMNKGFGYYVFYPQNKRWIMTRMSLQLCQYPLWEQDITVETWMRENKRIFFIRDFFIRDLSGTIIGKASASYALIDKDTKKPCNLSFMDQLLHSLSLMPEAHAGPARIGNLPAMTVVSQVKTAFSDIDLNGHVNNIVYLRWMLDALPFQIRQNQRIISIDVNYHAEMFPGETAEVYYGTNDQTDNVFFSCIIRQSDSKELCRTCVHFGEVPSISY